MGGEGGGLVLLQVVHLDGSGQLLVGRVEGRVGHPQRIQHPLFEEHIPLLAGDDLDDRRSDVDAGVGIPFLGARLEENRAGGGFGGRHAQGDARPSQHALGGNLKGESAGVVHHILHGQDILGLDQCPDTVLVGGLDPERLEFRKVFVDRIVQGEFSLLNQHRDGHAAESLCLRALHEHLVQRHRDFLVDIGPSHAGRLLDAILVEDTDRARALALLDVGQDRLLSEMGPRILRFRKTKTCQEGDRRHPDPSGSDSVHQRNLHVLNVADTIPLLRWRIKSGGAWKNQPSTVGGRGDGQEMAWHPIAFMAYFHTLETGIGGDDDAA